MSGTPVAEGLVEVQGDDVRLLGGRCPGCGRHDFPRADTCTICGREGTEPVALSPTGRLWVWTEVRTAPPGYDGPVPYGFGVVELPEDLRVVTRLRLPAEPSEGAPMRAALDEVGTAEDGSPLVTWCFEPDPGGTP